MNSAFKFFVRFLQIDNRTYTASGELIAPSYSEAVRIITNYHAMYGRILSIYIEELPAVTMSALYGPYNELYEEVKVGYDARCQ